MAITVLAAAKYPIASGESPVVNMWWTQRPKLRNAVAMIARTTRV